MKIYVASSWRNPYYDDLVSGLIRDGHKIWDWKNPRTGGLGFKWQDAGMPEYAHGDKTNAGAIGAMLNTSAAWSGYASDLCGMQWCDIGVLLYPSGRSAHLEAGWLAGRGKTVHVLMPEDTEPDLMIKMLGGSIFPSPIALRHAIGRAQ